MARTRKEERLLLRLLCERGFLDEDQAARFDPGPPSVDGETTNEDAPTGILEQLVKRGLIDAETLAELETTLPDDDPSPPVTEPASERPEAPATDCIPPELARSERYQVVRLLGSGGAGDVYLARDLRLDRLVALKVLSDLSTRALREARLQARVEHDAVCKVYETGMAGGRPFVAMQYVDGETLQQAARRMTREGIVLAVRDAALAVHAAHGIGLVHRDLKPGNIMIERQSDDLDKTYVLDFGLAKEMSSEGSTAHGSVLGTPAYMAPEQAKGDLRRIDKRTDVYGLGATLYHALGGAPPFEGHAILVLQSVLSEEPKPLRARDPSVSQDLEAIVHTCLDKDPSRRYPSARALAEDLDRYLQGEPVRARRTGVFRRLVRLARRHRAVAIATMLAAIALSIVGGFWVRDRIAARERAIAVRHFTEEADAIEAIVRLSHLAPLHDTRPERFNVTERLARIERELKDNPVTIGLAQEALGRGYLALGDYDRARAHLDEAWRLGERSGVLAFALARAYGGLYERGLIDVRRIADPKVRDEAIRALKRDLRDPALVFLRAAGDARGSSPELFQGYLAFLEDRNDEALRYARDAARSRPWLHEAKKLEGDVHGKLARTIEARGDLAEALRELLLAAAAYSEATTIGRSDAAVHEAECRVRDWAVDLDIRKRSKLVDNDAVSLALAACDRSLEANPDPPGAWLHRAHILSVRAEALTHSGGDPWPDLLDAAETASDLVMLYPDSAPAYAALGEALYLQGRAMAFQGEDGQLVLREAISAHEQATLLDPTLVVAHHQLGIGYREAAHAAFRRGEDPRPSLLQAVASYKRARELDPTFSRAYNSIGRAYGLSAEYELGHGLPLETSLKEGAAAYEQAARDLPDMAMVPNNAGLLWTISAADKFQRGEDPEPMLARAQAEFDRALKLSPKYPFALKNRGTVHRHKAEWQVRTGRDPSQSAESALRDYDDAIAIHSRYSGAYRGIAATYLALAEHRASRGESIEDLLAKGRAAIRRAEEVVPGEGDTQIMVARYALFEAAGASRQGKDPQEPLNTAEKALQSAHETSPQAADIHAFLAEVHLYRARWLSHRSGSTQLVFKSIEHGEHAARDALRIHPRAAAPHIVLAQLAALRAKVEPHRAEELLREQKVALTSAEKLDRQAAWKIRALTD